MDSARWRVWYFSWESMAGRRAGQGSSPGKGEVVK